MCVEPVFATSGKQAVVVRVDIEVEICVGNSEEWGFVKQGVAFIIHAQAKDTDAWYVQKYGKEEFYFTR